MKTPTSTSKHLFTLGRARASSVALLGLLFMPIAPLNAQGSNHVIAGTSADGEDLIVTVTWRDPVAAGGLELAVFDDNDLQIAGQLVWPIPGEQTQTTFDELLHNVPESGFQFSATVRDSSGRDVVQPHAFRVVIECPHPMELCQWRTQDGLYTNALATSESLMAALDVLEAESSSNLLADALEEPLDLRGPVFSLAAQIDQLDQQLGLGNECTCAWFHSFYDDPDERQNRESGPGLVSEDSGSELIEVEGIGATTVVAGQILHFPMSHEATATGTSRQTMELSCWKIHNWIEVAHLPLFPSMPPQAIRFPIMEACPGACRGTVESSATIDYFLVTTVQEPAGSNPVARAAVDGFLERDDGADHTHKDTWQAELQWAPGDTYLEQSGSIQIPTEGVFVDDDIREMTITLSGKATVELKAEEAEAWSYATAGFAGTLLQAKGHADCAIQPTGETELYALDPLTLAATSVDCGEPLIEPWVR